jgi:hypothetical protein
VRKNYHSAWLTFNSERSTVSAARSFLHETRLAALTFGGRNAQRIGAYAARFERALLTSRVGRSLLLPAGRIAASKPFMSALVVAGAVVEAGNAYFDSRAESQSGKVLNGALAGIGQAGIMASGPLAVADLVMPKGYKPSEVIRATANVATAGYEYLRLHDTKPLDDFHRRSMAGAHSKVFQAASEAGAYWSKHGVTGTMREFADSVRWWVAN